MISTAASNRMTTINSEQFEKICDFVWNDRASILMGRGSLSGEATLMRAVFWGLCKAGIKTNGCADNDSSKPAIDAYHLIVGRMLKMNARPAFDAGPILKALVERYQHEATNEN